MFKETICILWMVLGLAVIRDRLDGFFPQRRARATKVWIWGTRELWCAFHTLPYRTQPDTK